MQLDAFYTAISGDLAQVRNCFATDERIETFIKMFFEEPVYGELCSAVEQGNAEEAFRAAHTMKGLAVGMGFTKLHDASSQLTEALRPNASGVPSDADQIQPLFEHVQQEYAAIVEAYDTSS